MSDGFYQTTTQPFTLLSNWQWIYLPFFFCCSLFTLLTFFFLLSTWYSFLYLLALFQANVLSLSSLLVFFPTISILCALPSLAFSFYLIEAYQFVFLPSCQTTTMLFISFFLMSLSHLFSSCIFFGWNSWTLKLFTFLFHVFN